jgi:hypothetical protein
MPTTRLLRIPLAALGVGLIACGGGDMAMDTALAAPKEGWQPYPPTAGPPPGWTGPVFQLSVDFPSEPPDDRPPFLSIDFHNDREAYWRAVRAYIYEGNINRGVNSAGHSRDWNTQTNPVRTWYNMPWRAWGRNAREFVNGLTREFPSAPGNLDPTQQRTEYTWARAIFNPSAGYTLGQVWNDPDGPPNLTAASFPEGAVVAKLLFTTADTSDVPWVRDAYTWQANTYLDPASCDSLGCPRQIRDVHLYQIDFAIKDSRASETQWVFGTFVHDPSMPGQGFSWDKMVPLGYMWGNDPELTADNPNATPQESVIYDNTHIFEHMGCRERLVGPLDNPSSSCIGCHQNAQYPAKTSPVPPNHPCDAVANDPWWRNLRSGDLLWPADSVDGVAPQSLDFSMEMRTAVENYHMATRGYTVSADGERFRLTGSETDQRLARRKH